MSEIVNSSHEKLNSKTVYFFSWQISSFMLDEGIEA